MTKSSETSYDTWKLDCPPEIIQERPFTYEIDSGFGMLCWHFFVSKNQQENVADWAWKACKRGPFASVSAKLTFWFHLVVAKLAGKANPVAIACLKSSKHIDEVYLDACWEIQDTWRDRFYSWSLKAVQEHNYAINLYQCDFVNEEDWQ